ncbi:MAG: hypothetical protein QME61_03280, partial [Patescibacteria group bacterium]|nr:hypothetical protein [Patescibacteria group bacterium]
MLEKIFLDKVLICSLTPYFLEKPNFWFEKNFNKILEARKTQDFWKNNTLYLEKNQIYNFSQFLRKLDEMGYEKVWEVSEIGEFAQRGGVVDVFPVNPPLIPSEEFSPIKKEVSKNKWGVNFAIRIEFFGNKIEEIFPLPIKIESEKPAKEILKKKLKS